MNSLKSLLLAAFAAVLFAPLTASAGEGDGGIDAVIDSALKPIATKADSIIFFSIPIGDANLPIVLVLLGFTAVFLTVYFGFVNIRGFVTALKTARGKYTPPDAPGQITHFQALSAALSATVGLGNIAGVAVAIGLGGPGATFWMIVMGLCGMTTKFVECTLGVKYRKIDPDGTVRGGGMYYLSEGLKSKGAGGLGMFLAVFFAIMTIGGAIGAGNMFQVNQAHAQFAATFVDVPGWAFGLVVAVLVGLVIIGGIVWIARVTSFLVPFMCITYVIASLVIIGLHLEHVPDAFAQIFKMAFSPEAIGGGIIGVLIQGIKRAAFSNEAGLGSAPIAHSAVKTRKPASEGYVALLEPFVDTVVVCTMTALVVIITGTWQVNTKVGDAGATLLAEAKEGSAQVQALEAGQFLRKVKDQKVGESDWLNVRVLKEEGAEYYETGVEGWVPADQATAFTGIPVTSLAFEGVIGFFPAILSIAVILFAFSTMISWSYYGEQGVLFIFKGLEPAGQKTAVLIYKIAFCGIVVVGAAASLGSVLVLSDAMIFAMVFPNLIGVYWLLNEVKREQKDFLQHVKEVESGDNAA